ncbi:hypothetical protein HMN09_00962900 [Mycena chlorophos]|uniref:Uncharacterized protein n=1 Tax=Mycena chlorophos TaxID=658473 RepID=A0A8H6SJ37_MYCCL|nr:hypothetical protein HMN09_00962900 [Mycena chlorophos]
MAATATTNAVPFSFPAQLPPRSPSPAKSPTHDRTRTYSSSSASGVPPSDIHKPNAHPYAIKTTNSAALSRSLSQSSKDTESRHHYVPPSPSASAGDDKGSGGRRKEYRGHRYSRSLSGSEDNTNVFYSAPSANSSSSSLQGPRALPIPPNVSNNSIAAAKQKERERERENGAPASTRVRRHESLDQYMASRQQQSASPEGSRSPTRIEYATYEVEEPASEDENTPSKRPNVTPHIQASSSPFMANGVPASPSASPTNGRFRNGRVQGMVRSFESSGSESEGSVSPERERGSGFRTVKSGSGFLNGAGNGAIKSNPSSDGEGNGTMRPLPARPDGLVFSTATGSGGMLIADDTGATVKAPAAVRGRAAPMDASAALSLSEEELTVEQLLARQEARYGINGSANGSGSMRGPGSAHLSGTWGRKKGRRSRKAMDEGLPEIPDADAQQATSSRPLPPEPRKRRYVTPPSSGLHAWEQEAEEERGGLARSTMKWVPSLTPNAESVFAAVDEAPAPISTSTAPVPDAAPVPATPTEHERQAAVDEAAARGRARGAEIRALLAKSEEEREELKELVDGFRKRLEEVERKVGDMEQAQAAADKDKAKAAASVGLAAQKSVAPAQTQQLSRLDPRRLLALFGPTNTTNQRRNVPIPDDVGPTTIAGLPSYVLLVSLGVCAVVFRVLVKRIAKKA